MNADLEDLLSEREQAIARLRQAFRFSEQEAIDFLDRFGEAPAVSGPSIQLIAQPNTGIKGSREAASP